MARKGGSFVKRNILRITAIVAMAATFALGVPALRAQTLAHFTFPAQPLADTLRGVGVQTNTSVVFDPTLVEGRQAPALDVQLSLEGVLARLLAGTEIGYQFVNEHTVVLTRHGSGGSVASDHSTSAINAPPAAPRNAEDNGSAGGLHASQSDRQITSTAASGASAAVPAGSFSDRLQLEEIVVTAQKRAERLQDVPISIVALGADELAKRNITSIDDLTIVPGVAVQDTGSQRRIALRGIANVQGNASLTGIYLDEADVTSTGSGQLPLDIYDLQRVEVLRGPQGTLYGEGSIGGTIRFITNNPNLNKFEMKADVAALFTQAGAPSQRLQEVLNIPLLDNQLGLRIAGQFDHEGGWIDQPAANQHDINDQNTTDVRAKLLWQPSQPFSASGMAEIHRDRQVPSISEDTDANFTQVFGLTTTPRVTDNYNLYNLTMTEDLGSVRLLNSTTYFNQDTELNNWGHALHTAPPPAPPALALYASLISTPESSFNDELRLTSTGAGPWQWTLGGFYRDFRFSWFESYYFGAAAGPLPPPLPDYYFSGRSKAWSAFADTSYKFAGRLTVGAGVRRYSDDETYNYLGLQSATFHSVDPRFYAQFKLTDELNIYANAAKGFRSGGFNSTTQPTFGPENVWTYELGAKTSLLDQRLSADADVFYSNYHDYITYGTPLGSAVGLTQNAGDAVIKGFEWDISWRATDQWTFSLNGDYLDSYFTKIALQPATAAFAVADNVDFVYKYQGSFSVERDFRWSGKPVFTRLDYNLQGPATYRNRSNGSWYFDESNTISMLNANVGVQWNDNLSLGVFAQNLLNDRGFTSSLILEDGAARARPRTYGITFAVSF